ncbi:MAG: BNR-4 repeat-containing protein, partial [Sedimentisphaerales bacterium]|nr:BNR-4 repeat-containing protein [Sedimentisphaerales bacterium]
AIDVGHYQTSIANERKAGTVLNYHPKGKGLNWRTNLYYLETTDFGKSWHAANGRNLDLPLTDPQNAALVHDCEKEGLLAYLKDIRFDEHGLPVILYITSKGFESGPKNDPRTWTTARWTGEQWEIRPVTTSDNNYDMGSLYIEDDGTWRIVGPTQTGPQPYNPGGEMAQWASRDRGATWRKVKELTHDSAFNHTYARHPVNVHDEFYALWADGHGRQPSESSIYFCNKAGDVYRLPHQMAGEFARPERVE